MTVGIRPCQIDPSRLVMSPVSHYPEWCVVSRIPRARTLVPTHSTHDEEEEERETLARLLPIAQDYLVQRAVRSGRGVSKRLEKKGSGMYGIGVHEDPSSERAPTEREGQPRMSVFGRARTSRRIVVMMHDDEEKTGVGMTETSESVTARIHGQDPHRTRTVDLDWLVVPAWRCWWWQLTRRPSRADDGCQSEHSGRNEQSRP